MSGPPSGIYTILLQNRGTIGPLFKGTSATEVGLAGGFTWEVTRLHNESYSLVARGHAKDFYVQLIEEPSGTVIVKPYRTLEPITWYIHRSPINIRPVKYTIEIAGERPGGRPEKYWTLHDDHPDHIVLDTLGPHSTQEFTFEKA